MKNKILCPLLAFVLIIYSLISITYGTDTNSINNEENNTTTSQNNEQVENAIDSLNQQKEEVEEKINESNTLLEYVQTEMSNTLLQIQQLDDEILKYEERINELNEKVQSYEQSLEILKQELEKTIQEYTVKDEIVRERLVAIARAGEVTYLDVLLKSKSLPEFLSNFYLIREITETDIQLMQEVEQKKNQIEEYTKKIEEENTKTMEVKAQAEQISIVLTNTKSVQEGYISSLQENEKKLNEEITKYKEEQTRIELIIMQISTSQNVDIQYTGGPLIWPVAKAGSVITSSYGYREHPIQGIVKIHQGIDIGGVGFGAPIVAVLDGVVSFAGELGSYGNCVMIDHGNGITTLYAHGQKILTERGKEVKQGDLIMEVGSTGNSTGPHCHFEIRINGYTQDPLLYVSAP